MADKALYVCGRIESPVKTSQSDLSTSCVNTPCVNCTGRLSENITAKVLFCCQTFWERLHCGYTGRDQSWQ